MTLTVTQNTIQNNLTITQSNVVVKLQPVINASAQIVETDPIFQASEASNFVAGDKSNLDNQSGVNTGDETTSSIQTKRPLKTVNGESLEGSGNIQIDYNDLDNLPTIPPQISNHSELSLDDGTNPHGTTKSDVGLGDVPNLDTTNAVNNEHTHSNKTVLDNTTESFITALKNAYDGAVSWITTNGTNLINHLTNYSNPHNVTKSQVGLSNVDNTSDANKPISTATQNVLDLKLNKDTTAGVERAYIINADGSQGTKATSEFKDVLEFANLAAFPVTGETGIIYIALDTNKTYRWSGSVYVQIGGSSEEIWNTSRYANWRILKAEALGGNQGAIGFTNNFGFINIGTVSLKTSTYSTGNFIDTIRRIGLTSAATAGSSTQRAPNVGIPCSTKSGFYFCADTISEDAATVATAADLVGLGATFAGAFGNAEPSTATACILLAYDSTDTNMQIMHNDSTGTCTKIDLGVNFPARTNATDLYRLELFCATNGVEIKYRVTRLNTGHQVSGTLTTNIPSSAIPLTLGFWRGNRTTALAVTKSFSQITIATPY